MKHASKKTTRVAVKPLILNITPANLSKYFDRKTREWHKKLPAETALTKFKQSHEYTPILAIHFYNFKLWHTEDEARRTDVTDEVIAATKREVDRLNQLRNNSIEDADVYFSGELEFLRKEKSSATYNTETLGNVIDRLSILSLKIYHMSEEAKRKSACQLNREKAKERLCILMQQRIDLGTAAADLIADLIFGKKKLHVYRQFKMYNDPTLNPALYKKQEKQNRN